ncbi:heavy-metal-associated domain-containing protein [Edaphobacter aggregans]|uniref:heavy-metal-associated domain-containing protein n=1 Tax=Edaphobacter aggregans TaxID=570835 RepID=UPI00055550DE
MEIKTSLLIEGMHCEACVRRVTNALNSVEGVRADSVKVGSATVTFNPTTAKPEQIAAVVDGIGFTARVEP